MTTKLVSSKLVVVMLSLLLCFVLAGCGKGSGGPSEVEIGNCFLNLVRREPFVQQVGDLQKMKISILERGEPLEVSQGDGNSKKLIVYPVIFAIPRDIIRIGGYEAGALPHELYFYKDQYGDWLAAFPREFGASQSKRLERYVVEFQKVNATLSALADARNEAVVAAIVAALPEKERPAVESARIARLKELKATRLSKARATLKTAVTEEEVAAVVSALPEAERASIEADRSVRIIEVKAARENRLAKAREDLAAAVTEADVAAAVSTLLAGERGELETERAARLAQVKADREARVDKARDALKTAATEEDVAQVLSALPAAERGFVETDKTERLAMITRERAERNARVAKACAALKNAKTEAEVAQAVATLPEAERPLVEKERVAQISQIIFEKSLIHPKTVTLTGGVELVLQPIPAGKFKMGNPASNDNADWPHGVTISKPFLLGKYEITQEQWLAVMGDYPRGFLQYEKGAKDSRNNDIIEKILKRSAKRPMNYVSWDDAMAFCRKLTEQERKAGRLPDGWRYTLPTEAQWEYACRAGTTGDYGGSGELDEMGWYSERFDTSNSGQKLHEVGLKKANHWGLYDMHGNVAEWCLNFYYAYPNEDVIDPTGPQSDRVYRGHVHRGGHAFFDYYNPLKSYERLADGQVPQAFQLGFRVALSPVGSRSE